MSWWAVGPAGSAAAAGTQQAPDRSTAEKDAQAYGETVLAGPFGTQAQAQAWTASGGGGTGGSGGTTGQGIPGKWYVVVKSPGGHGGGGAEAVEQAPLPIDVTIHGGPFNTKAEAEKSLANLRNPAHLPNPLSGLAAIGDFFAKLGQANTWIRVAEVLLGVGLIIVGLAKLASGTAAGRAAIKAGKAAAIL